MKGAELRALVETFYDIQKNRVAMNNRLCALEAPTDDFFLSEVFEETEKLEEQLEDEIGEEVSSFDLYADYLSKIKGLGPLMGSVIMSELALPRRFERIPDRDGEPRRHEEVIEETDDGYLVQSPPSLEVATKVSQLWSYCGYGDPDEKRTKGEKASHNPFIKKKLHTIAECFLRSGSYYRTFYDDAKKHYQENRDWTDGHIHNASYRIVKKLFLSHVWEVYRTWNDLSLTAPYVFEHTEEAHAGYVPPFIEQGGDGIETVCNAKFGNRQEEVTS